jgi:hypothetical protein
MALMTPEPFALAQWIFIFHFPFKSGNNNAPSEGNSRHNALQKKWNKQSSATLSANDPPKAMLTADQAVIDVSKLA